MVKKPTYEELERQLVESNQLATRFRCIFRAIPDATIFADTERQIVAVNPALTKLFGYEKEELLGRHTQIIYSSKEDYEALGRTRFNLEAEEKLKPYEIAYRKKGGENFTCEVVAATVKDDDGKSVGFLGILRDITQRKRTEAALRESEDLMRQVFNTTPNCIFVKDRDGRFILANESMAELYGTTPEAMIGKTVLDFLKRSKAASKKTEELLAADRKVIDSKKTKYIPLEEFTRDGRVKWFQTTKLPLVLKGDPNCVLGVAVDITERVQTEEQLRTKHCAIESSISGIAITDIDSNLIYVNPHFLKMWGYYDDKEVLGRPGIKFWQMEEEATKVLQALQEKGVWIGELSAKKKDGTFFHAQVSASTMTDKEDSPKGIIVSFVDITERKRAEEQIGSSLKEKEMLLAELHHRVKNNFQVISSLLDMITMRTQNQEAIDLFTDARSKIYSMALVHTQLYEEKRFDRIDFGSYIERLVDHTGQVYSSRGILVTPVVDSSDVYLSLNQAVPCALVLNEVISNVYKHAFKKGEQGKLEVSFRKAADNMVLIRVKDDGIGIPEEMDIDKAKTLGLKLVKNLVQSQLKGKLQVKRDNGTEIIIEFKAVTEGEEDA